MTPIELRICSYLQLHRLDLKGPLQNALPFGCPKDPWIRACNERWFPAGQTRIPDILRHWPIHALLEKREMRRFCWLDPTHQVVVLSSLHFTSSVTRHIATEGFSMIFFWDIPIDLFRDLILFDDVILELIEEIPLLPVAVVESLASYQWQTFLQSLPVFELSLWRSHPIAWGSRPLPPMRRLRDCLPRTVNRSILMSALRVLSNRDIRSHLDQ